MTTVAITGVGGLVGSRLAAELAERPGVERIVGLDLREPEGLSQHELEFRRADVRDPAFHRFLADVDMVVHLAYQMDPLRDRATMRSVNVEGTQNVFEAAARAGVSKVVYASTALVYGAHPDNDFPLSESSPLRANPDFDYAEQKLEIERWLEDWRPDHPDVTVTVLRLAIVAGPGVENFITRVTFESPRPFLIRGHKPPLQFVHIDDVTRALVHAVDHDLAGAFNVAAEGWLSMDEVIALAGRKPIQLPEEVAFTTVQRLWDLGVGEMPPGVPYYLMHPWVISPDKLIETGWRPKHSNRDALAELVEEHRDWVALGKLRARRSTVRKVAAVTGVLAALAVARRVSSARRD